MPSLFSKAAASLIGLGLALASSGANAADLNSSYYGNKESGYWWYKDPKEAKPKPPIEPPPQELDQAAKREKVPFTLEWLRKNFDRIKEEAIENPDDKDKVRAYLYAVRVIQDKAQNFADSAHEIAKTDPYLDASSRVPISAAALRETLSLQDDAKRELLNIVGEKGGLWFFFDTRCKYCQYQHRILEQFKAQHPNIRMRYISLDGKAFPGMKNVYRDQGQARRLNLKITPAVVFVSPPANLSIISLGMNTVDELEKKTIMAARIAGMLPEDILKQYQYHRRGNLETKDLRDGVEGLDMNDPKEWVKFLQDKIEGRY